MGIFKIFFVVNFINYSIVLIKNFNEFKSFVILCIDGSIVVFLKNKWCNYIEDCVCCIIVGIFILLDNYFLLIR